MSTPRSSQLNLRHVYILDVRSVAISVEEALASFNLLPPEPPSLFLPHKPDPVLVQGNRYWYETVEAVTHPSSFDAYAQLATAHRYRYYPVVDINAVAQQLWDIVDRDDGQGKLVVSHREVHLLSPTPTMARVGLKILRDAIDDEVRGTRAYEVGLRVRTIEELVIPYTLFKGQDSTDVRDNIHYIEMFTFMYEQIQTIRNEIREFLHGNPYAICEIDQINSYTFQINVMGDHRILEWEKHKASGKW